MKNAKWVITNNDVGSHNVVSHFATGSYVVADDLPIEDASLIAAAPDLYAALEEAVLQIQYLHEKFQETGTGNTIIDRSNAALAKARGEG